MSDLGTGIAIVFSTSGFTAELMSVNGSGIAREPFETTNHATVGFKTYKPKKIADQGTVEMELAFDPDTPPPINGAVETVTITFPLPDGGSTEATLAGQGFFTEFSFTAELEEKMTATATLQWAGEATWTAST